MSVFFNFEGFLFNKIKNKFMDIIEKQFYHLFWTNKACREIFSVHKAQLLESEVELIISSEKFYAQRLVLTNSQERNTSKQITKRNENESIKLMHNLKSSARKYFDEDKMETYMLSKFNKTIKKIESEIKGKGWFRVITRILLSIENEKDFFKLLSSYHLIPFNIENESQFMEHIENEIKLQTKLFLKKENLSDLAISIDLFSTFYNNKIKNNLISASKHYTDIFFDSEQFANREILFDDLFEIKVIKGGRLKSYYECVKCPPDTLNGVLTTNLKPSCLKINCPNCQEEMHYIVPYEIDTDIYKNIIHKDGILFFAIKYLLNENHCLYKENQIYLEDVEIDFCLINSIQNNEFIEIKMFKTDRPEDTQITNLKNSISQIKKIIDKLRNTKNPSFNAIQYSLVTNLTNNNVYKKANIELEDDLREFNIKIYSMEDYYAKLSS